ncbi:right-handed parallel beta-helix repeat-containing protein, partial [uncultured Amaricoccus sp.]|uniref:right-handed parallel beta-helix repeat-containing protein n=1 Tax=uncultured Amaricoccus sp. TaxID=339341 RepID=UPI00260A2583
FKSAKAGDVLSLAGGNYGSVTLASGKSGVTIKSASDGNQAVFSKLSAQKVSNFTIDNVKFDGPGKAGTGLTVKSSAGVKILNSDFTDLSTGSFIYESSGVTMSGNTFTRMYIDAMDFAEINNGVISNNYYQESGSRPGYTHKDFIQFWTHRGYDQAPSKNITISGNKFYSKDGDTHGILITNEWGSKHQNIKIVDNYFKSSQTHGISVATTDGLEIRNNTLIKDGKGYPVINVTPDSTNVKITNNTSPSIPDVGNSTWFLSGNKETGGTNWHWTDGMSGSPVKNTGSTTGANGSAASAAAPSVAAPSVAAPAPGVSAPDLNLGNGKADEFRFDAAKIAGGVTKVVSGLDFSDDDTIVLINYDKGTIKDVEGGNLVWHNLEGTYVKIDSLTDIQEIVAASSKIAAKVTGDDLTLSITQNDGTHHIVLDGIGQQYQSSFDSALF